MAAVAKPKQPANGSAPAIDRSAIRYLLSLTPEQRIRLAAEEARNLHRFDLEVKKSKGR